MNTIETPRQSKILKSVIISLTLVYFWTNVVCASMPPGGFWQERQAAVSSVNKGESPAAVTGNQKDVIATLAEVPTPAATLPDVTAFTKELLPTPIQESLPGVGAGSETGNSKLETIKGYNLPDWVKKLPLAFVSVEEIHVVPNAARWVVLIQDVHGQAEAQRNIAEALRGLAEQTTVRISLEGASGPLALDFYRSIPDPQIKHAIADFLLSRSMLTGAEYAGVMNSSPLRLEGSEDTSAYLENIRAFKDSISYEPAMKDQLGSWKDTVADLKKSLYSPALLELDNKRQLFQDGKFSTGEYLTLLASRYKPAGDRGIAQEYPQIEAFRQALILEQSLDFSAVERQRNDLLAKMAQVLSREELQELLTLSLAYRLGKVPYGAYYRALEVLCQSHGLVVSRWPAFEQYLHYLFATEKIQRRPLFEELMRLEKQVVEPYLSDTSRSLWELNQDVDLVDKLAHQNLTSLDWELYRRSRPRIRQIPQRLIALTGEAYGTGSIAKALPSFSSLPKTSTGSVMKWLGFGGSEKPAASLVEMLDAFEAFYMAATRRNEALVRNTLKLRTSSAGPLVLVAGGFHTQGVEPLFREAGYNTIILSPRLTKVEGNASDYLNFFRRDQTPLDKVLLGEKLFLSPPLMTAKELPDGYTSILAQVTALLELGAEARLDQTDAGRVFDAIKRRAREQGVSEIEKMEVLSQEAKFNDGLSVAVVPVRINGTVTVYLGVGRDAPEGWVDDITATMLKGEEVQSTVAGDLALGSHTANIVVLGRKANTAEKGLSLVTGSLEKVLSASQRSVRRRTLAGEIRNITHFFLNFGPNLSQISNKTRNLAAGVMIAALASSLVWRVGGVEWSWAGLVKTIGMLTPLALGMAVGYGGEGGSADRGNLNEIYRRYMTIGWARGKRDISISTNPSELDVRDLIEARRTIKFMMDKFQINKEDPLVKYLGKIEAELMRRYKDLGIILWERHGIYAIATNWFPGITVRDVVSPLWDLSTQEALNEAGQIYVRETTRQQTNALPPRSASTPTAGAKRKSPLRSFINLLGLQKLLNFFKGWADRERKGPRGPAEVNPYESPAPDSTDQPREGIIHPALLAAIPLIGIGAAYFLHAYLTHALAWIIEWLRAHGAGVTKAMSVIVTGLPILGMAASRGRRTPNNSAEFNSFLDQFEALEPDEDHSGLYERIQSRLSSAGTKMMLENDMATYGLVFLPERDKSLPPVSEEIRTAQAKSKPMAVLMALAIYILDKGPETFSKQDLDHLQTALDQLIKKAGGVYGYLSVPLLFLLALSPHFEEYAGANKEYVRLSKNLRFLPGEYGARALRLDLILSGLHLLLLTAGDLEDLQGTLPAFEQALTDLERLPSQSSERKTLERAVGFFIYGLVPRPEMPLSWILWKGRADKKDWMAVQEKEEDQPRKVRQAWKNVSGTFRALVDQHRATLEEVATHLEKELDRSFAAKDSWLFYNQPHFIDLLPHLPTWEEGAGTLEEHLMYSPLDPLPPSLRNRGDLFKAISVRSEKVIEVRSALNAFKALKRELASPGLATGISITSLQPRSPEDLKGSIGKALESSRESLLALGYRKDALDQIADRLIKVHTDFTRPMVLIYPEVDAQQRKLGEMLRELIRERNSTSDRSVTLTFVGMGNPPAEFNLTIQQFLIYLPSGWTLNVNCIDVDGNGKVFDRLRRDINQELATHPNLRDTKININIIPFNMMDVDGFKDNTAFLKKSDFVFMRYVLYLKDFSSLSAFQTFPHRAIWSLDKVFRVYLFLLSLAPQMRKGTRIFIEPTKGYGDVKPGPAPEDEFVLPGTRVDPGLQGAGILTYTGQPLPATLPDFVKDVKTPPLGPASGSTLSPKNISIPTVALTRGEMELYLGKDYFATKDAKGREFSIRALEEKDRVLLRDWKTAYLRDKKWRSLWEKEKDPLYNEDTIPGYRPSEIAYGLVSSKDGAQRLEGFFSGELLNAQSGAKFFQINHMELYYRNITLNGRRGLPGQSGMPGVANALWDFTIKWLHESQPWVESISLTAATKGSQEFSKGKGLTEYPNYRRELPREGIDKEYNRSDESRPSLGKLFNQSTAPIVPGSMPLAYAAPLLAFVLPLSPTGAFLVYFGAILGLQAYALYRNNASRKSRSVPVVLSAKTFFGSAEEMKVNLQSLRDSLGAKVDDEQLQSLAQGLEAFRDNVLEKISQSSVVLNNVTVEARRNSGGKLEITVNFNPSHPPERSNPQEWAKNIKDSKTLTDFYDGMLEEGYRDQRDVPFRYNHDTGGWSFVFPSPLTANPIVNTRRDGTPYFKFQQERGGEFVFPPPVLDDGTLYQMLQSVPVGRPGYANPNLVRTGLAPIVHAAPTDITQVAPIVQPIKIGVAASIIDPLLRWMRGSIWGDRTYWFFTVVVSSVWETGAFHAWGYGAVAGGFSVLGLGPLLSIPLGIFTIAFLFAAAHTIVAWLVRSQETGWKKNFAIRFGLSVLFTLPFLTFNPFAATLITIVLHSGYNSVALKRGWTLASIVGGRITPGITWKGRNAPVDRFINNFLKDSGRTGQAVVVELGIGDPPVTMKELAENLGRSARRVVGVDLNVPAYTVDFTARGGFQVRAYFDETGRLTFLARNSSEGSYQEIDRNSNEAHQALTERDRLLVLARGNDLKNGGSALHFHPMERYLAGLPNVTVVRGGFDLPGVGKGEADVVRAFNVFMYYRSAEAAKALELISAKLREGGILLIGERTNFVVFRKMEGRMEPFQFVVRPERGESIFKVVPALAARQFSGDSQVRSSLRLFGSGTQAPFPWLASERYAAHDAFMAAIADPAFQGQIGLGMVAFLRERGFEATHDEDGNVLINLSPAKVPASLFSASAFLAAVPVTFGIGHGPTAGWTAVFWLGAAVIISVGVAVAIKILMAFQKPGARSQKSVKTEESQPAKPEAVAVPYDQAKRLLTNLGGKTQKILVNPSLSFDIHASAALISVEEALKRLENGSIEAYRVDGELRWVSESMIPKPFVPVSSEDFALPEEWNQEQRMYVELYDLKDSPMNLNVIRQYAGRLRDLTIRLRDLTPALTRRYEIWRRYDLDNNQNLENLLVSMLTDYGFSNCASILLEKYLEPATPETAKRIFTIYEMALSGKEPSAGSGDVGMTRLADGEGPQNIDQQIEQGHRADQLADMMAKHFSSPLNSYGVIFLKGGGPYWRLKMDLLRRLLDNRDSYPLIDWLNMVIARGVRSALERYEQRDQEEHGGLATSRLAMAVARWLNPKLVEEIVKQAESVVIVPQTESADDVQDKLFNITAKKWAPMLETVLTLLFFGVSYALLIAGFGWGHRLWIDPISWLFANMGFVLLHWNGVYHAGAQGPPDRLTVKSAKRLFALGTFFHSPFFVVGVLPALIPNPVFLVSALTVLGIASFAWAVWSHASYNEDVLNPSVISVASPERPGRNEDSYLELDFPGAGIQLRAVFDGVGDGGQGREASQIAAREARIFFATVFRDPVWKSLPEEKKEEAVKETLEGAMRHLDALIKEKSLKSTTTATVAVVRQMPDGARRILVAQAGDSRAYLVDSSGFLFTLTIDNAVSATPVDWEKIGPKEAMDLLEPMRELDRVTTYEQARRSPAFQARNVITTGLGHGDYSPALFGITIRANQSGRLLLTSDGVSDVLTQSEMKGKSLVQILEAVQERAALYLTARERFKLLLKSIVNAGLTIPQNKTYDEMKAFVEGRFPVTAFSVARWADEEFKRHMLPVEGSEDVLGPVVPVEVREALEKLLEITETPGFVRAKPDDVTILSLDLPAVASPGPEQEIILRWIRDYFLSSLRKVITGVTNFAARHEWPLATMKSKLGEKRGAWVPKRTPATGKLSKQNRKRIEDRLGQLRKEYKQLKKGRMPKAIYIGDQHGNPQFLQEVLRLVEEGKVDQVIFHGDLFNKGSENMECLNLIQKIQAKLESRDGQLVVLMGNHEDWFIRAVLLNDLQAFESWITAGGIEFLQEVFHRKLNLSSVYALQGKVTGFSAGSTPVEQKAIQELRNAALWYLKNARMTCTDQLGIFHVHAGIEADEEGNVVFGGKKGPEAVDELKSFETNWEKMRKKLPAELGPHQSLRPEDAREIRSLLKQGRPLFSTFRFYKKFIDLEGPDTKQLDAVPADRDLFNANLNEGKLDRFLRQLGVRMIMIGHESGSSWWNLGGKIFDIDTHHNGKKGGYTRLKAKKMYWATLTQARSRKMLRKKDLLALIQGEIDGLRKQLTSAPSATWGLTRTVSHWLRVRDADIITYFAPQFETLLTLGVFFPLASNVFVNGGLDLHMAVAIAGLLSNLVFTLLHLGKASEAQAPPYRLLKLFIAGLVFHSPFFLAFGFFPPVSVAGLLIVPLALMVTAIWAIYAHRAYNAAILDPNSPEWIQEWPLATMGSQNGVPIPSPASMNEAGVDGIAKMIDTAVTRDTRHYQAREEYGLTPGEIDIKGIADGTADNNQGLIFLLSSLIPNGDPLQQKRYLHEGVADLANEQLARESRLPLTKVAKISLYFKQSPNGRWTPGRLVITPWFMAGEIPEGFRETYQKALESITKALLKRGYLQSELSELVSERSIRSGGLTKTWPELLSQYALEIMPARAGSSRAVRSVHVTRLDDWPDKEESSSLARAIAENLGLHEHHQLSHPGKVTIKGAVDILDADGRKYSAEINLSFESRETAGEGVRGRWVPSQLKVMPISLLTEHDWSLFKKGELPKAWRVLVAALLEMGYSQDELSNLIQPEMLEFAGYSNEDWQKLLEDMVSLLAEQGRRKDFSWESPLEPPRLHPENVKAAEAQKDLDISVYPHSDGAYEDLRQHGPINLVIDVSPVTRADPYGFDPSGLERQNINQTNWAQWALALGLAKYYVHYEPGHHGEKPRITLFEKNVDFNPNNPNDLKAEDEFVEEPLEQEDLEVLVGKEGPFMLAVDASAFSLKDQWREKLAPLISILEMAKAKGAPAKVSLALSPADSGPRAKRGQSQLEISPWVQEWVRVMGDVFGSLRQRLAGVTTQGPSIQFLSSTPSPSSVTAPVSPAQQFYDKFIELARPGTSPEGWRISGRLGRELPKNVEELKSDQIERIWNRIQYDDYIFRGLGINNREAFESRLLEGRENPSSPGEAGSEQRLGILLFPMGAGLTVSPWVAVIVTAIIVAVVVYKNHKAKNTLSVAGMPAQEILSTLGLLSQLGQPGEPVEGGLTRRRITLDAIRPENRAAFTELVQKELAWDGINEFDLLYDARGYLIGVVPVIGKDEHGMIPVVPKDQAPHYFDFSAYYFKIPRIGDPQAPALWEKFSKESQINSQRVATYVSDLYDTDSLHHQVWSVTHGQSPYVYAEYDDETGQVILREIPLGVRFNFNQLPGGLEEGKEQIIFPVFPTVYSPAQVDHYTADNGYVKAVAHFNEEYKKHWESFGQARAWRGGNHLLVIGGGSGFDTWLAYHAWRRAMKLKQGHFPVERPEIRVRDINPLAVANIRLTLATISDKVKLTVEEGDNAPTEGLYDLIIWNMPYILSSEKGFLRQKDRHDGDPYGRQAKILAQRTFSILAPTGFMICWNMGARVMVRGFSSSAAEKDYGSGGSLDLFNVLMMSAGRYDPSHSDQISPPVMRVSIRPSNVDSFVYFVSHKEEAPVAQTSRSGVDLVIMEFAAQWEREISTKPVMRHYPKPPTDDELKRVLTQEGVFDDNAVKFILDRFDPSYAGPQVVGLGESHRTLSVRTFMARLIPHLYQAGVRHIILEIQYPAQELIDRFLRSGKGASNIKQIDMVQFAPTYMQIFEAVRRLNRLHPQDPIQIHAVDTRLNEKQLGQHADESMTSLIKQRVFDKDPNAKAFVFFGAGHIAESHYPGSAWKAPLGALLRGLTQGHAYLIDGTLVSDADIVSRAIVSAGWGGRNLVIPLKNSPLANLPVTSDSRMSPTYGETFDALLYVGNPNIPLPGLWGRILSGFKTFGRWLGARKFLIPLTLIMATFLTYTSVAANTFLAPMSPAQQVAIGNMPAIERPLDNIKPLIVTSEDLSMDQPNLIPLRKVLNGLPITGNENQVNSQLAPFLTQSEIYQQAYRMGIQGMSPAEGKPSVIAAIQSALRHLSHSQVQDALNLGYAVGAKVRQGDSKPLDEAADLKATRAVDMSGFFEKESADSQATLKAEATALGKTLDNLKEGKGPVVLFARERGITLEKILEAMSRSRQVKLQVLAKLVEAAKAGKLRVISNGENIHYINQDDLIDAQALTKAIIDTIPGVERVEVMTENPGRFTNLSTVARLIVILANDMVVELKSSEITDALQNQKLFSIQA